MDITALYGQRIVRTGGRESKKVTLSFFGFDRVKKKVNAEGAQNENICVYFAMSPRPAVGAAPVAKRCSFQTM